MRLRLMGAMAVISLAACARPEYRAPAPAPPRAAVALAASSASTWKAVLAVLARDSIRIVSMDSSTGMIGAVRTSIPSSTDEERATGRSYADCGTTPAPERGGSRGAGEVRFHPVSAEYSIVVRVSGGSSTLRSSARYVGRADTGGNAALVICSSTGRFESEFESAVKARVEGGR